MKVSKLVDYVKENYADCEVCEQVDFEVNSVCNLDSIKSNSLVWVKNANGLKKIQDSEANNVLIIAEKACRVSKEDAWVVYVEGSKACFFDIVHSFFTRPEKREISSHSVVSTQKIGRNVNIGDFSVIGEEVVIEDDVYVGNNVSIICPAVIGKGTIINDGVVIGTRGYGFYRKQTDEKIPVPHIGGVLIGENVEIGANTCIDRGTLSNTVIEDGVKIDNLCHIAHNVHIGKNSMVIAHSMIGGSASVGENVYIAPGVLVINQCTVESNSLLGMGAVVTENVGRNKVVVGVPAKPIRDNSKPII
ncbi:MAG: hypothetical protein IK018_11040 [Lachnospiraceae bacterium]|nr:hypothetical protein [Lachnospiraceae bacterium]